MNTPQGLRWAHGSSKVNKSFAVLWILVALAIPFACGVLVSYSASTLLIILITIVPVWLLAALTLLAFAVFNAIKKRWGISLYRLAAGMIATASLILIPVGIDAGYYLRLWSFQNYYEAEVAKLPKDNNPRFRLFDWGGYFIFNTIVLAYDESDELSLAPGKQSPEWTARTNERTGGFFGGKWTAEHLQGHYYVVTTY